MRGPSVIISYHVQFFGHQGERGWVPATRLIRYEGVEKLHAYCDKQKNNVRNKSKELYSTEVSKAKMAGWNLAIQDADHAAAMEITERKLAYTYVYVKPEKGKKPKKAPKRKLEDSTDDSTTAPPVKKIKQEENVLTLYDLKVARFVAYCQKNRDAVRAANPDCTELAQEMLLKKQWMELSEEERYVSKTFYQ